MIDLIFYFCVKLLQHMAALLGTTYEAVNVWIFVVGYPIVLGLSIMLNIYLIGRLRTKIDKKI